MSLEVIFFGPLAEGLSDQVLDGLAAGGCWGGSVVEVGVERGVERGPAQCRCVWARVFR